MLSSRLAKMCAASLALAVSAAWTGIFPAFAQTLTGVPFRENGFLIAGMLICIWALVTGLILTAAAEPFLPKEPETAGERSFRLFLGGLKPRRDAVHMRLRNRRIRF